MSIDDEKTAESQFFAVAKMLALVGLSSGDICGSSTVYKITAEVNESIA